MIARPDLPPGPFLVVGLARSGIAAALALRARGEDVAGTDTRALEPEDRTLLADAGVRVEAPDDLASALSAAIASDRTAVVEVMTDPDAYPPITAWEGREAVLMPDAG